MPETTYWVAPGSDPSFTQDAKLVLTDVDPAPPPPPPPPVEYDLTHDGISLGSYPAGTAVVITAGTPPAGEQFASFSLVSGSGAFTASQTATPSEWTTGAEDTVLVTNYEAAAPPPPPPPPPEPGELHEAIQAMPAGSWLAIKGSTVSQSLYTSHPWKLDNPPSPFAPIDGALLVPGETNVYQVNFGKATWDAANGTIVYNAGSQPWTNGFQGDLGAIWNAWSGATGVFNYQGAPSLVGRGSGHGDGAMTLAWRFDLQTLLFSWFDEHRDVTIDTNYGPDKTPQATHTYGCNQIVTINGKQYFASGGGSKWRLSGTPGSLSLYDIEAGTWDYDPASEGFLGYGGSAVDAFGNYWGHRSKSNSVARYDNGQWVQVSSHGWATWEHSMEVHHQTEQLLRIGHGDVWTYDTTSDPTVRVVQSPTGDLEPVNATGPGLAYRIHDGLLYMHTQNTDYFTMDTNYHVTRHQVPIVNEYDPSAGPYDPISNPLVASALSPGAQSNRGASGYYGGKFRAVNASGVFVLIPGTANSAGGGELVWLLKV